MGGRPPSPFSGGAAGNHTRAWPGSSQFDAVFHVFALSAGNVKITRRDWGAGFYYGKSARNLRLPRLLSRSLFIPLQKETGPGPSSKTPDRLGFEPVQMPYSPHRFGDGTPAHEADLQTALTGVPEWFPGVSGPEDDEKVEKLRY
jgi:hypothetical protein